ncbi:unnamed protein product [Symbiodinium sp. CCMP2456]|nr:unnamed protein product [Symbiodinium sp. CCMP2456]
MARNLAVLPFLVLLANSELEPEECPLLQLKAKGNASVSIPRGPTDDLKQLSPQEWALSVRGLQCAASTYESASEPSQCGRILKEVPGPDTDGAEFMLARLIRSEDGQFAGKCWVAFRGTANKRGWQANFDSINAKESFSKHKILVASSWLRGYRLLEQGLKKAVHDAYQSGDCDPKEMYYTGHSLGGVLANYAALDNMVGVDGHQARYTITAGCPRPWWLTTGQCRYLSSTLPVSLRFVRYLASGQDSTFDMVPNLPPSLPGWPWQKRFRHCARRNIGLWAEPAANAPSHCKNGMHAEQCAISAIVHGVQQLASNAPYGGIGEGDAGLHDSVDYATIVEVDSQLQASNTSNT